MKETTKDTANPDLASELAYVRSLAEEGRDAPLVGGIYYVLWGALMGAASAFAFLGASDVISVGAVGMTAPWVIAGILGWTLSLLIGRNGRPKPGAMTLGNRTAQSVWFSVGVSMTVFWLALMIVHDNFTAYGVPAYFLFSLMFPIAFGVYGVAFFATAVAARLSWLKAFAALSWAFCVLSMFLLGSDVQFLAGSAGCLLCAVLPGAMLMRGEPKEIV
ncbi:MAG: hypothetical protein AAFW68_00950 [Pseudomonadota bacterium]